LQIWGKYCYLLFAVHPLPKHLFLLLMAAIFWCGTPVTGYTQEVWTGVAFRVKPVKRVNIEAEQQFRFQNNFSSLYSRFIELGVGYDITSRLNVHVAYRHTDRTTLDRVDDDRRRVSAEASYNIGSDNTAFVLSYRLRYQAAQETSGEENRDNYVRNRLALTYNLTRRAHPYATTEVFYKLSPANEIRAFWFTMGLKSKIGKSFGLNTFYRIEKELNVKRPQTNLIVGVMLAYRLKLYKKSSSDDDTPVGGY
jgi:predicted porin